MPTKVLLSQIIEKSEDAKTSISEILSSKISIKLEEMRKKVMSEKVEEAEEELDEAKKVSD